MHWSLSVSVYFSLSLFIRLCFVYISTFILNASLLWRAAHFLTRIYRGQTFSNSIFSCVLILVSPDIYLPLFIIRYLLVLLNVVLTFCVSVMLFPVSYFIPKLICFFYIQLSICLHAISTNLLVEFSFIILEILVTFCISGFHPGIF